MAENETIDNNAGKSWKLSYVIIALAIVAAIVCFGLVSWHRISSYQAILPTQNLAKLEAEFQKFRKINGHFPKSFLEINEKQWKQVPGKHVEGDALTWQKDHFYYRIVAAGDELALWAVPYGERRDEAQTYFVVMSATWRRAWKGAAIPKERLGMVKVLPNPNDLAVLNMEEQKAVTYK